MMRWDKKGMIYEVKGIHPKLLTHASNPLAVHLNESVFRIFYSGRDEFNKSSVGFVDMDIERIKIVAEAKQPIVTFGDEKTFYSHGISIGNYYEQDDSRNILFMGWNIRNNEHWRGDIGRIELSSNYRDAKISDKVFLGIDQEDPISLSYPFVLIHEGIYKMWYGSTITWEAGNNEMLHVIKYATSTDGLNWSRHGIAIPYELGVAQAFSRPIVLINNSGFNMWYSYRGGNGDKYKIGYANSIDGIHWQRRHDLYSLDISKEGWDSDMVCYPFVFEHNRKTYMLYNGNDYGKLGFGLAILEN